MMMSKCFIGFLISDLGEPNIYHDLGVFYKEVGRLWRVSDFEELSLARGGIERPSHGFKLDSQTYY